jgi:flagellar M-ring protein FliF
MLNRLKTATVQQQVLLTVSATALLALLLWLGWYYAFSNPMQPLFRNLRPANAAPIIAELDKRKISYVLSDGGTTIEVPADKADAIRISLSGSDLPIKDSVGFELFNKSDMGLTDFAQQVNYQRALQGELARTIMGLDGVESARVHLSLGEDHVFRADRILPKASIYVRMDNERPVLAAVAQGIQQLVAAAVPRLDAANVVVVDEAGNVASLAALPASLPASAPLQEKRAVELYFAARIKRALESSWQQDHFAVTVWADTPPVDSIDSAPHWDIASRNFRLLVTLSGEHEPNPDAERDIRSIVSASIQGDGLQGDTITFGPAPVVISSPAAVPDGAAKPDTSPRDEGWDVPQSSGYGIFWMVAVVAGALALLWKLMRMGSPAALRRLTPMQHQEFAARLQATFMDETSDASPIR